MVNVSEVPAKIPRIALKILCQLCPYLVITLVWFSDCKICKQKKFRNQTEEVVKGYPLSGNVFTLDALHCQKETTIAIVNHS